jgi:hypothetical protein
MKLTDTQRLVLFRAAQRDDRAFELPNNLKGGAAHKLIVKLVSAKLIEEVCAQKKLPVWRHDTKLGPRALRITKAGVAAVHTDNVSDAAEPEKREKRGQRKKITRARPVAKRTSPVQTKTSAGRAASKQACVLAQLSLPQGATIAVLTQTTGWQPHSVRGFLAGIVRKKLGLDLVSEKTPDGRVYRIVGA